MTAANPTIGKSSGVQLAEWLRGATPAFLFALRLWASVCLTYYVTFALMLSDPTWAVTTAAIVCTPVLGASLRKAFFRMIGTVVGAIGIVILAALFRQDRIGFLIGLALWCAVSAFVATLLRNFAAYAAALSGYTAAILASDVLGPVGTHWRRRHVPCDQSRDRDLHGHPVRGRHPGLDRSRPLAAKARGGACFAVDGDHGRVRRLFSDRQLGLDPVSRASTRPLAAHHCARSDDRRGDRRGLRPPLSLASVATSGVRPRGNNFGVAQGCISRSR